MNLLLQSSGLMNEKTMPYLILGFGALVIMYVVVRPMMRRKKDPFEKPTYMRSLSQQRSVERQMENLLVELSEMSRQMTAQLDSRAAKLELLIKDADERLARLKQATNNLPGNLTMPSFPAPDPMPAISPSEDDQRHRAVYDLADSGKSVPEIATALAKPSGEVELILALRRT